MESPSRTSASSSSLPTGIMPSASRRSSAKLRSTKFTWSRVSSPATGSSSRTSRSGARTTSCASAEQAITGVIRMNDARELNPHEPEPLIRMRGITKVFYTDEIETHALSGIHCDIRRGEFVSISGPSGCGKSTLLAILGLLDTPSGGEYHLNGRPVAEIGVDERA